MSNNINRNFKDLGLFIGVINSLVATGHGMQLANYANQPDPGEINVDKIEAHF